MAHVRWVPFKPEGPLLKVWEGQTLTFAGTDAEVVKVLIQLPLTNKAVCDDICKKALDAVLSQGADLKTTAAFLKMKDPVIEFTTAQPTSQGMGSWVFPAVAYIRDAALDLKELARSATNRPRSRRV